MNKAILNKIVFIMPTCEPEELFKWLLPSVKYLVDAKDYISFAIGFQPPYTNDQIKKVTSELDSLGFDYKYFFKDYKIKKPNTPLMQMRQDCALLYPNAAVYGLLDDDMSFMSNDCAVDLLQILLTFLEEKSVGVVACKSFSIQDWYGNIFATDAGLFYRGGIFYDFEGLIPNTLADIKGFDTSLFPELSKINLLSLVGGYQDKFCAMIQLLTGKDAKIFPEVKVTHVENRRLKGAIAHGWMGAAFQENSVGHTITKYLNPKFMADISMSLFSPDVYAKIKEQSKKNLPSQDPFRQAGYNRPYGLIYSYHHNYNSAKGDYFYSKFSYDEALATLLYRLNNISKD